MMAGPVTDHPRLTRLPDWQPRLQAWLRDLALSRRPLVPGQHDCCLFAASAVLVQTGVDLAAPWRGRYTTFRGGLRLIRASGHADLPTLLAAHLHPARPLQAAPGDIALIATPEGPAMGVVQGAAVYVLAPDGRLGGVSAGAIDALFKLEDR